MHQDKNRSNGPAQFQRKIAVYLFWNGIIIALGTKAENYIQ